jgi:hypothetical protein
VVSDRCEGPCPAARGHCTPGTAPHSGARARETPPAARSARTLGAQHHRSHDGRAAIAKVDDERMIMTPCFVSSPCPFCGERDGKVECSARTYGEAVFDPPPWRAVAHVRCTHCHARGPQFAVENGSREVAIYCATRRAIRAWGWHAPIEPQRLLTALLEWLAIGCLYRNVPTEPSARGSRGLDASTWWKLLNEPPAAITDW